MVLTSGDVADIRLGFESLDVNVNGFLGIEDIHTLFLGLGYAAVDGRSDKFLSVDELRNAAGRDSLTVEETMGLFGRVSYVICALLVLVVCRRCASDSGNNRVDGCGGGSGHFLVAE
jgi:hypothetical protein